VKINFLYSQIKPLLLLLLLLLSLVPAADGGEADFEGANRLFLPIAGGLYGGLRHDIGLRVGLYHQPRVLGEAQELYRPKTTAAVKTSETGFDREASGHAVLSTLSPTRSQKTTKKG
jgi:hypothetical protein